MVLSRANIEAIWEYFLHSIEINQSVQKTPVSLHILAAYFNVKNTREKSCNYCNTIEGIYKAAISWSKEKLRSQFTSNLLVRPIALIVRYKICRWPDKKLVHLPVRNCMSYGELDPHTSRKPRSVWAKHHL